MVCQLEPSAARLGPHLVYPDCRQGKPGVDLSSFLTPDRQVKMEALNRIIEGREGQR